MIDDRELKTSDDIFEMRYKELTSLMDDLELAFAHCQSVNELAESASTTSTAVFRGVNCIESKIEETQRLTTTLAPVTKTATKAVTEAVTENVTEASTEEVTIEVTEVITDAVTEAVHERQYIRVSNACRNT